MSRHFERQDLTQRYDQFRPLVHDRVMKLLFKSLQLQSVESSIDIATGTGHVLEALKPFSNHITGTDISEQMLMQARQRIPEGHFINCSAENIPLEDKCADLITVSMAYHWFDASKFLNESQRLLQNSGHLAIYNLIFPGISNSVKNYHEWHKNNYWSKYPNPKRNQQNIVESVNQNSSFRHIESIDLDFDIEFDAQELAGYLTTHSNIDLFIEQGGSMESVDKWLIEELTALIKGKQHFKYTGKLELFSQPG